MSKLIIFSALLVVALPTALSMGFGEPGYIPEEAPFTVVKKTEAYEIRSYPETKWICRDNVGKEFKMRAQAESFFALHEYFMGENSGGAKLNMTVPVTVHTVLNADSQGNTLNQMCVYIPKMYQENPLQPKEKGIFIQNRAPLKVAARKFNAYMIKETEFPRQVDLLRADLKTANEPNMDINDFFGAGYDPPFKADARHNEVWIVKKE